MPGNGQRTGAGTRLGVGRQGITDRSIAAAARTGCDRDPGVVTGRRPRAAAPGCNGHGSGEAVRPKELVGRRNCVGAGRARLSHRECLLRDGQRSGPRTGAGVGLHRIGEAAIAISSRARREPNDGKETGVARRLPRTDGVSLDGNGRDAAARGNGLAGGRNCERADSARLSHEERLPGDGQRSGARSGAGVGRHGITHGAIAAAAGARSNCEEAGIARGRPSAAAPSRNGNGSGAAARTTGIVKGLAERRNCVGAGLSARTGGLPSRSSVGTLENAASSGE